MLSIDRAAIVAAWLLAVTLTLSPAWSAAPTSGEAATLAIAKNSKAADKKAERKAAKKDQEDESKVFDADYEKVARPEHKSEKPSADAKKSDTSVAKKTVVRIALHGEYPEGATESGVFGDMQPSLAKLSEKLEEAAADKNVAAIWLRIEDLELGRGKINEVRAAIARVQKAGKPVYAEISSADSGTYLVASACDKVFMPSSGVLVVAGVRAEVSYYKGLLDKLGLKFDGLQMGKFKGAGEPMTRTSMSGPLRESLEAIVDDAYEHMVSTIAVDRHLLERDVKKLIDLGLFSAKAAQKAGLIDDILYSDEIENSLARRLKVDKIEVVSNYKKKQVDTDFSGIGGFVKLMELFSGGNKPEKTSNKQKIAVVYAVGEIVEGKSQSGMFSGASLGSTSMVETLRKAFDDPKVVAVVLRVDSPGGSATASDLIWRETVRTKKPMVASMGNVAGSGGYYIAMGAKKIFAEPGTITGSIGVIGGKLVTGGLYEKAGINTEIISRGKNSGAFSANQPFSESERKAWTKLLKETYHEFVSKAAAGRRMEYNQLEALAQGRVYTGRQAKKLGLIDEVGTLEDAVASAKSLAGLKPDADIDIETLPKSKNFFEQLFSGDGASASEFDSAMPEVMKTVRQAATWRKLLNSRVLLWMPYSVELK